MKLWPAVIGALGLFGTAVGLVGAFSFQQLQTVTCNIPQPPDRGNIIDCLHDIRVSAGDVVLLDWTSYIGEPMPEGWEPQRYPFLRRIDGASISWGFDLEAIAVEACDRHPSEYPARRGQCGWIGSSEGYGATEALVAARYSAKGLSYRDIGVPDNGLGVTIVGGDQSVNPFSSFHSGVYRETWAGTLDRAEGPYQITLTSEDAFDSFRLSPAPMTDELARQIRCSRREWHALVRFIVCPFA